MEIVIGIAGLVGIFMAIGKYHSWLERSVAPRVIETNLNADQLRNVFDVSVAKAGWKIVDTGNPRVAQSSLLTGMRQQISLTIGETEDGKQIAVVQVPRLVVKLGGVPTKAHTLRMRMNSFTEAVAARDRDARIAVKASR